jgi:hypothetical protein
LQVRIDSYSGSLIDYTPVNGTFATVDLSTGELSAGKPDAVVLMRPPNPTMGYELEVNSDDVDGNFVSLFPPDEIEASRVFQLDDGVRPDGCPKAKESYGNERYSIDGFQFFVSQTATPRAYLLYGTQVTDADYTWNTRNLVVVASTSVDPNSMDKSWSCSLATSALASRDDGLFEISIPEQSFYLTIVYDDLLLVELRFKSCSSGTGSYYAVFDESSFHLTMRAGLDDMTVLDVLGFAHKISSELIYDPITEGLLSIFDSHFLLHPTIQHAYGFYGWR